MSELLRRLVEGIDAALPQALELRAELHRRPRLSHEEGPTRDLLTERLGFVDWTPVAETGAIGRLGPSGRGVALRAELDALPVAEETGVAWASESAGIMHACGHDVHMAALWAFLTSANDADLPLGIVPVLQPREEDSPSGAVDVLASGQLARHECGAMIGVHVQPRADDGTISTGAGAVNAAFDTVEITVHGEPGHGAYPHVSIDPISTLASIVVGLNELAARAIDPTHPHVIGIGKIEGGTTHNVVPATAKLLGTIRTMNEDDRALIRQRITMLAEGVAASRGARAEVVIEPGQPMLYNDPALVAAVDPMIEAAGVRVTDPAFRSCGSDDFSAYCDVMPSLMMFVGTGGAASGVEVGLHHARYLPDNDALRRAAIAYAAGYVGACDVLGR